MTAGRGIERTTQGKGKSMQEPDVCKLDVLGIVVAVLNWTSFKGLAFNGRRYVHGAL